MARTAPSPALTANNHIYLYRLLAEKIGCGKQTFLPKVEDALASDRMTADDLGFESTRELLEALESFVKLTIFKGGRMYATVIAQPEWDAALAAPASAPANSGKSNKPWKRKKTDKALKPVRPKRVKRPEPEPETKAPTANEEGASAADVVVKNSEATDTADCEPQPKVEANSLSVEDAPAAAPVETSSSASAGESGEQRDDSLQDNTAVLNPQANEAVEQPALPQPAISLTVVYDPYSGVDRETTIQSHPVPAAVAAPAPAAEPVPAPEPAPVSAAKPKRAPAPASAPEPASASAAESTPVSEAAPVVAPAPAAAPSEVAGPVAPSAVQAPVADTVSPEVLVTYPRNFSEEVYLSSEVIAALCELLPYGTDVFTLLAEDWTRARELDLVSGTRARATFPLRIQHASSTEPITVTLKRRANSNLAWEFSSVK